MKHNHHKIPRHAGGTDNPENLELLTIEEHAEAHRRLFEEYGRWRDRAAWHLLASIAPVENARRLASEEGRRAFYADPEKVRRAIEKQQATRKKNGTRVWNTGKTCLTQISENTKHQAREGNFHNIGDYQRGRTFDEDHRRKLSEKAMKRTPKTCEHCGISSLPAMHARWRGDNCKRRP
jgi:hypothetical protein